MNLSIIAAIGKNRELGKDSKLIWYLPGDLKFFKKMTTGKTIVMGRITFESLGRLLPERHHIVITKGNIKSKEVEIYNSIHEFMENYKSEEETFIIGGGTIYKEFIKYVNKMYLTEINASCKDADVYFPIFDERDWTKEELARKKESNIEYKHILYKRRA